mmetsp:Transcript_42122/g.51132  ORF Transcript_42122/g.51132 Transcript_42122/m.51132 type:complete len:326 (-) Transcript_42122:321-1298(-)|eukprot:CAMPEP_0197851792 /NCGR_PEP_ID=MMETSP1438-20131217/18872_1 /TAXON_ID=1461541 /ORGANISM="Pterosperma sp., Strain CCMP1384" /LENGTH=325 /DNA_ID=CAMNT_0043465523 /DNA_START=106 /DNA_END=1083 /DNA_ORIENTATION=-
MVATEEPCSAAGLKNLFEEQHGFLDHFFAECDYSLIQTFCKAILDCKGTVFMTGVGKSGFIAQKISMTLVSTGTKSVFLSPTDALHGDIGIVSKEDLLVLFSKSGNTDELLNLIPYAKAKGATLIGIHSQLGCKLQKQCDMHVHLPLKRELCPFDLAPVTSTAIQMLFGDTCAVAIMQAKNLTMDQYAMNHPAGRIGKRLILKVCDVMKKAELPQAKKEDTVLGQLTQLSSGFGCLLICDANNKLEGCFTDGDLRRALSEKGSGMLQMTLGEVMTANPRTVEASSMAKAAMEMMEQEPKVDFLPVVEGGELKGLITLHLLVAAGL